MTHVQEVVGSNPGTIYWMEMTFFSLICCINCIVLFEKTENKQKEAGVGPFKKVTLQSLPPLIPSDGKMNKRENQI